MSVYMIARDVLFAIWHWYLHVLWNPAEDSWVMRIAYTFRIMAFISIAPVLFLAAVDVSFYLVARTLGFTDASTSSPPQGAEIISDTKAKQTLLTVPKEHSIAGLPSEDTLKDQPLKPSLNLEQLPHFDSTRQPSAYFLTPTAESSFALSGVGVFSPAGSRSNSPPISRKHRAGDSDKLEVMDENGEGASDNPGADSGLRQRKPPVEVVSGEAG